MAAGATFAEASNPAGVLSVTGELGAALSVVFAGSSGTVTKTVAGQGTTPIGITLSPAELSILGNGQVDVTVSQIDPAGNASAAATASFNYDTVAPAAPAITTAPSSSNALNQRIAGTAEAARHWDAVVYLKGQGAHSIRAWQRDAAGHDGPTASAPLQLMIDTVAAAPALTKEVSCAGPVPPSVPSCCPENALPPTPAPPGPRGDTPGP